MSALPDRLQPEGNSSVSPQELLQILLSSQGIQHNIVSYKSLSEFFFNPTEDEINSYRSDVLDAVRTRDISALRSFYEQGRPMKCSNQFGESILHLACRRGFLDVVQFLVEEASVPLRVRDDYGRTPLHDALWTTEPNPELVDYIITQCPDLLYIKDRRENTPFSYVRKNDFAVWIKFLENLPITKLAPKLLFVSATKQ
jgi:ankyrin repeat protein